MQTKRVSRASSRRVDATPPLFLPRLCKQSILGQRERRTIVFVFCPAVQEERGPRVRNKIASVARHFSRASSSPPPPPPPPPPSPPPLVSLSSSLDPGIVAPILIAKETAVAANPTMRYHATDVNVDNGLSFSSMRRILYSPRVPTNLVAGKRNRRVERSHGRNGRDKTKEKNGQGDSIVGGGRAMLTRRNCFQETRYDTKWRHGYSSRPCEPLANIESSRCSLSTSRIRFFEEDGLRRSFCELRSGRSI